MNNVYQLIQNFDMGKIVTGACQEDFPGADWRTYSPLQIAKIIAGDGIRDFTTKIELTVTDPAEPFGMNQTVTLASWTREEWGKMKTNKVRVEEVKNFMTTTAQGGEFLGRLKAALQADPKAHVKPIFNQWAPAAWMDENEDQRNGAYYHATLTALDQMGVYREKTTRPNRGRKNTHSTPQVTNPYQSDTSYRKERILELVEWIKDEVNPNKKEYWRDEIERWLP